MTLDEFDALQIGDKIKNERNNIAEVIASGAYGHKIIWAGTSIPYTMYRAGRMWIGFEVVPRNLETAQEFPSPTEEP